MPVDLSFGQGIAQSLHNRVGAVVHQHLLRPRLGRHVVDERNSFVEEVTPPALDVAPYAIRWQAAPFRAGDELTGDRVQAFEEMGEGAARRLLHRQHLDVLAVDIEMIAVAVHRAIRGEVVDVRVVLERRAVGFVSRVVQQPAEEPKSLCFGQTRRPDTVGNLNLERRRFLMELRQRTIQFHLEESARRPRR